MCEIKYMQKISLNCDELIKTNLTCPICLDTYDRSHHLPKLLSHCHTICIKCLEGVFTQSTSGDFFLCPICRGRIDVPREGISGFRNNPFLIQVLDQIDNCEVIPECSKHPLDELQYCEPCDALFCDSCDDESHCNKNSSEPEHSSQRFSLAMKRKSNTLICQADNWLSRLNDADKTVTFVEDKIKERSDAALKKNDAFFTKIRSLLDKRCQEVSLSILQARNNDLKTLHDQRLWIAGEEAKVTAEFKRFKHRGAVGEVAKKIEELNGRVESKKDLLIPKENSLRYLKDRVIAESAIKIAIEGWGRFQTSKILPSLCEARLVSGCFAKMWGSFTIVTKDFFGNNCKLDDLDAICATKSGLGLSNTTPGSSFYDDGGGNYSSDFGLSEPGIYQLKVTIFDCPIKNYPLEFEVKKYENSIYSTNQLSNKGAYLRSLGVKLTVNQKEVKIGPHEWTLGTESVLPLRPTYCQILDVEPIFFASLDCSDIAWMCDFSSVWKVSLDRGKERVTNVFSILSFWERLKCIEMVPGYDLSSQPTKIDSIDAELQTTTCYIKEDIGIKEARSEATFRRKFENLSQVNDSVFSPTFFVRNLPWRILVQQLETESVKTLGVNLYCDGCPESSYWSCKAEAEFRLIRQNGDEPLTRKFGQANVFAKNHQTWGFSEFADWNDVLDPSKGFIKDDLIILEVSVSADTPQGCSNNSMQYNGYVPLAKQAARSDLLLPQIPFLFSNGANVINSSGSMPRQDLSVQSLRTIWLGSYQGTVYILSAEDQSVYSSIKIKLPDSVVQIIHFKDKVFIALLNGECCVFIRSQENLCWNFSEYFLVDINETSLAAENTPSCTDEPNSSKTFPSTEIPEESMSSKSGSSLDEQDFAKSIRCMESVGASIWLASQNSIYILDCETLRIISRFDINDRTVGINKMVATEEYVWFSCSNRIIQLFSAIEPYEKVMSIDIRPDLKRMLIPALTDSELDSIAKITALKASNNHLWVGTAAGIILIIPYKFTPSESKCDLSQAQLSLHGFGGEVMFFFKLKNGMMSVGPGYRDLMIDPDAGKYCIFDIGRPHIIVWEENK